MENLPQEIVMHILSLLSPYRDQEIASLVCKRWKTIIDQLKHHRERQFEKDLINCNVQWYELSKDDSISISPRNDMAVCYNDQARSIFVFGGKSTSNNKTAGFNDLLRLDMHTLAWNRPPIKGSVPPPSSKSILLSYKNILLLYSGLYLSAHNPFGPEVARISNDLYTYDVENCLWRKHDYLESDCPPPMIEKSACVMVHDPDLEMDAFYILGNENDGSAKCLWSLDLHEFQWEKQILYKTRGMEIMKQATHCQIYEVNSTAYSCALLVISSSFVDVPACLLFKTGYNEWCCDVVSTPTLPLSHEPFFKRQCLATCKVKDTLMLITPRPATLVFRGQVREPKPLHGIGRNPSPIDNSPQRSLPPLGAEFTLAKDFVTLFLLGTSDINKEHKLKFVDKQCDTIEPCFTCRCNIRHGTVVHGRGELILVSENRPRNNNTIPVFVLKKVV